MRPFLVLCFIIIIIMELRLGVVGFWICASKNWVFDWMDVVFFDFYFFYSFKKYSNGQGGQSRMGAANLNSESNAVVGNARITQNGVHAQSQLHGIYTRFDLCIPLNIFLSFFLS